MQVVVSLCIPINPKLSCYLHWHRPLRFCNIPVNANIFQAIVGDSVVMAYKGFYLRCDYTLSAFCRYSSYFNKYLNVALKPKCIKLLRQSYNSDTDLSSMYIQWRNYYGLRPGEPGGPKPQWAKWGPPGSGCRAKTLARASDMSQCRFLTIRIL